MARKKKPIKSLPIVLQLTVACENDGAITLAYDSFDSRAGDLVAMIAAALCETRGLVAEEVE